MTNDHPWDFTGKTAIVTAPRTDSGEPSVSRSPSAAHTSGRATFSRTSSARRKPCAATPAGPCRAMTTDVRDRAAVDACGRRGGGGLGSRGHPAEQRRRRARTSRTAPRADYASGVAGDLRRQRHRRVLFLAGGGAGHEGRGQRTDRQHLERRRPWHQPSPASRRTRRPRRRRSGSRGSWRTSWDRGASRSTTSRPGSCDPMASYGEEGQRALVDRIALKRLGTPDDIAYGVLFFASGYASWITGQVMSIDGGKMTADIPVLAELRRNHDRIFGKLVEFASIRASAPIPRTPRTSTGRHAGWPPSCLPPGRSRCASFHRRQSRRVRRVAGCAGQAHGAGCTVTTTCSRPTRSRSGTARRGRQRCATAASTPAACPTTRDRC